MKVFVFSTHAAWQPHLETELEIIQGHLDKGDAVYRFTCAGELPICDVNTEHTLAGCVQCRDMSSCGKSLLDGSITDLPLIHKGENVKAKAEGISFNYDSAEVLQGTYVENFDVGSAVLSSLISWVREPKINIEAHRKEIGEGMKSALLVYFSALEYIKELKPDVIYCFNGRLVHARPILRAAAAAGVECMVHERGNNKNFYMLFKNTTSHDRKNAVQLMYDLWAKAPLESREATGAKFYTERAEGKEQGWYSFTNEQVKGLLPEGWDATKRNVIIFNSSEDEFASIGPDWKNDLYTTQLEAIPRIIKDCEQFDDIHFYLRVHPNLANVENSETKAIEKLSFKNLTIIDSKSKISTYDLLFNCEKILAFGSSVGIEAVYWGKPSIQAGKSYYHEMDATYKPETHAELIEMIGKKLEPMSKTPALIYGHYFKTFGIPYKYYVAETLATGTYKGVNINKQAASFNKKYKDVEKKGALNLPLRLLGLDYRLNKRKIYSFIKAPK